MDILRYVCVDVDIWCSVIIIKLLTFNVNSLMIITKHPVFHMQFFN
jgi:hypothetical protein